MYLALNKTKEMTILIGRCQSFFSSIFISNLFSYINHYVITYVFASKLNRNIIKKRFKYIFYRLINKIPAKYTFLLFAC